MTLTQERPTPSADGLRPATSIRRRRGRGLILAIGLLLLAVALSMMVGSASLSIPQVLEALTGHGTIESEAVVWELRAPRTLGAIVVGLALAAAGAVMQAMVRNPLADPGILGVNAGAALGGVASALSLLNPDAFDQMRFWNAGSLQNRTLDVIAPVLPFLLAGLVLALLTGRAFNAFALGEHAAKALGVRVATTRTLGILAVTLLAGSATAIAGLIGFVGLMMPHVARRIVGTDHRLIIAYSAVLGPTLVLVSDVVGRIAAPRRAARRDRHRLHRRPRPAAGRPPRPAARRPRRCRMSDSTTRPARSAPESPLLPRSLRALRAGPVSRVVSVRAVVTCALLLVVTAGVFILSLGLGRYTVLPGNVVLALLGLEDGMTGVVVREWRLARGVAALVLGAALGIAGCVFQSLTRNPLGSPDVIGFSTGAYTGAIIAMVFLGGGFAVTAGGAVLGGAVTAAIVYLVARGGASSGFGIIIVGIALTAILPSLNTWMLLAAKLEVAMSAAF